MTDSVSSLMRVGSYLPMALMLFSGALNTLLMKFMVLQKAPPTSMAQPAQFDYPFFQTQLMMLGELLCLFVFMSTLSSKVRQGDASRKFPYWIIIIPSCCDWTATTLCNAAYVIIPASTIQMCRGCIVLFTCVFSQVFLHREQQRYHIAGVALVALGITLVSLQELLYSKPDDTSYTHPIWMGIALTLGAQMFQAAMLVIEEKYLSKYSIPPMELVGLEGLFGSLIGLGLLLFLQETGFEKSSEAIHMMHENKNIVIAAVCSMFSIALFNWSGVTVTQTSSATSRSTIDVSRTSLIWIVELYLHWNTFSYLQLSGFIVLTIGTLLYNEIIRVPCLSPAPELKPLLPKLTQTV